MHEVHGGGELDQLRTERCDVAMHCAPGRFLLFTRSIGRKMQRKRTDAGNQRTQTFLCEERRQLTSQGSAEGSNVRLRKNFSRNFELLWSLTDEQSFAQMGVLLSRDSRSALSIRYAQIRFALVFGAGTNCFLRSVTFFKELSLTDGWHRDTSLFPSKRSSRQT